MNTMDKRSLVIYFVSFLVVLCSLALNVKAQTCNAKDGEEFLETEFSISSFDATNTEGDESLIELPFPTKLVNNAVRLVEVDPEDGSGDVAGSVWTREKRRLADGFVADFSFSINGGSDGFGFVMQNDKIENIEGKVGDALGFKEALDKYLAVGFDVCVNRADCSGAIKISAVTSPEILINETFIPESSITKDGTVHTGRIYYLANLNTIEVEIDGASVFSTELGSFDPRSVWGEDRFAYIGFTASNLGENPAVIDIHSLALSNFLSEARLRDGTAASEVQIGTAKAVVVDIVDTCNTPSSAIVAANNISVASFDATLVYNPDTDNLIISPLSVQEFGTSGTSFSIIFEIRFIGNYKFEGTVNGVEIQGTPIDTLLVGVDDFSLSPAAIAILSTVLALLLLASLFAVRRLMRYRSKLNEFKDEILGGRQAELIAELDKTVEYTMSPLQGDLQTLQEQLDRNVAELEKLKKNQNSGEDVEYTLDQLKKENAELLTELNRRKKENQITEAISPTRSSTRRFVPNIIRREFGQQRASMRGTKKRGNDEEDDPRVSL